MDGRDTHRFADGLERHVLDEEESLRRYQHLGAMLREGPAGLLVRAIFLDEEHHHHLLRRMAEEVRALPDTRPALDPGARADAHRMIDELLAHEEATIEKCRTLRKQLAEPESDLFAALLEALICDSEKHKRLLIALEEFVED